MNPLISLKSKQNFYQSLASYYEAGLSVQQVFSMQSALNDPLVQELSANITSGGTVSAAMELSRSFNSLDVGMVKIGEETGRQPQVFKHLAAHIENVRKAKRRALIGLLLPLFYIHTAALILPVPRFVSGDMTIGGYLGQAGAIIALTWAVVFCFFILLPYLTAQHMIPEGFLRLVPILGSYYSRAAYAQFLGTVAMGLEAGISLIRALSISSKTCASLSLKQRIDSVVHDIDTTGCSLSSLCSGLKVSQFAHSIIETGEQTGTLAEKMQQAADEYQKKNKQMLVAISIVAPILIYGIVVLFIGFQIITMYMGIYDQYDSLLSP